MARKNHGYEIYKKYNIDEIIQNLKINNTIPDGLIYSENDLKDSIRRVQIIKDLIERDGIKCVYCESIPMYFGIGKDRIGKWHLDLYGGNELEDDHMFTIDHIHPKSRGGENKLDNYQILCKICNEDKSDSVNGVKTPQVLKYKKYYIDRKLTSLTEQIIGIFNKIKNRDIICINNQDGFTVGNKYRITDIKLKTDKKTGIKYQFIATNDDNLKTSLIINNFITKLDYISQKNK